ncbi:MAG: hypothetical protein H6735_00470 [Alphaproteobacteria bacterium]|nr:hypothetical protein [Alphaproteobacteria bacterium]
MLAILRVDERGRVTAANDAAKTLFGRVVGQRCCDVVVARDGRDTLCTPDCSQSLAAGDQADSERPASIRGRRCELVCTRVGADLVVVVRPGPALEPGTEVLTLREREVLGLVAAGVEPADIARRLRIGGSTVRTHVERARSKLGARTRAEAVARALARGEIPPPE